MDPHFSKCLYNLFQCHWTALYVHGLLYGWVISVFFDHTVTKEDSLVKTRLGIHLFTAKHLNPLEGSALIGGGEKHQKRIVHCGTSGANRLIIFWNTDTGTPILSQFLGPVLSSRQRKSHLSGLLFWMGFLQGKGI